jgi:hypothetical protein
MTRFTRRAPPVQGGHAGKGGSASDTLRHEDGAGAELTSDSRGGAAPAVDGEGWGASRIPARRGECKELAKR